MRFSVLIFGSLCLILTACAHKKVETAKVDQPIKQAEAKKNDDKSFTCNVQGDKRVILLDKMPKRCEVHYTKFGESNQVAWAEATPSLCGEVYQKIRTNIESAGFKCESSEKQLEAKRETAAEEKKN